MALNGYMAAVKAQSSAVAFLDEPTTTSDNTVYTITDTAKKIWDLDTEIVVEDGGVPTTESYKVNRLKGQITFSSANPARVITVSGSYVVLTTIGQAKAFTFNGTADVIDSTTFASTGFRTFEAALVSGTASLNKFYEVANFFINLLLSGERVVIEYYPDDTGDPISFFALAADDTIDSPVEGLIEESIDFQITTEINPGV